jgi:hypothetical protein
LQPQTIPQKKFTEKLEGGEFIGIFGTPRSSRARVLSVSFSLFLFRSSPQQKYLLEEIL